ncbi:hypothetical protein ACTXT7_000961 [Hymenolepis weldensis]
MYLLKGFGISCGYLKTRKIIQFRGNRYMSLRYQKMMCLLLKKNRRFSRNLPFDGFLPSVPGTPANGQKCIVDQNGMVYVAMCHVSQTPRQLRANLTASRVTLTTFQPEASPKLNQLPQGGQDNSIRAGPIATLNLPSVNYLPRKEFSGNAQKNSSANQPNIFDISCHSNQNDRAHLLYV